MADDDEEIPAVALRQRSDDEALVAGTPYGRDEPLLLEPVQRAAHRGATRPHARDDGPFGDARARRQLSGDDQLAELPVYARDMIHLAVLDATVAGGRAGRRLLRRPAGRSGRHVVKVER